MTGNAKSGRKLSPERMALLAAAVEDGWPIRQMQETYGFNFLTVKKHYPEYHGMSAVDSGKLSMATKKLERMGT